MSDPAYRWSSRFLDALDAIGFGANRRTGGRMARAGDIVGFSLSKSIAVGVFHAHADEIYRARIAVRAFDHGDWARAERELAARTDCVAKLLAGELPAEAGEVFDALGLPLFPRDTRDIAMQCPCPNWQVPCEHLSAVCHRIGEVFDCDPFEILAWRGRRRDALLERLIALRVGAGRAEPGESRPLAECLDSFWGAGEPVPPRARSAEGGHGGFDLLLQPAEESGLDVAGQPIKALLRPLYTAITREARGDGPAR